MWIIDRFEGEHAVVEADGITFNIPKAVLPEDVSEGDCISVAIDANETQKRKDKAHSLINKLFKKDQD